MINLLSFNSINLFTMFEFYVWKVLGITPDTIVATEALAQLYGYNAFKYSDKIVVFIGSQSTKKGVKHAGT